MNKYFLYAASVLALASCSNDDFLGENSGNGQNAANSVINFGGETGKITRADNVTSIGGKDAADLLNKNFVLVGFKNAKDGSTYAFDHYNVNYVDGTANTTESNTAGWEYVNQSMKVNGADVKVNEGSLAQSGAKQQTIKYWDRSCESYDFIAFSMGNGEKAEGKTTYATPTSVNKNNLTEAAYTLTGNVKTLGECYISDKNTVKKAEYSNKAVAMSFRHLTSKVRIALYETVPGYVINNVQFYNVANGGTGSDQGTLFGKFNNNGTLTVYFPTTKEFKDDGSKNADYNKAHVKFEEAKTEGTVKHLEFGTVNYNNQSENEIKGADEEGVTETYLSQTASTPSYCGATANYYQAVIPTENSSEPANLRIDYTLKATDGTNEVINVKGATATVPAEYTKWKPGYAYTYIFKISQNTNGSTGDDDKKGLTAISFDAVVVSDEVNGQETITTVSDPSITTYGFKDGKVTANKGEYEVGTDIYATVHVPATETEAAKTAAPQNLYTVTIEADAAQTINEASVANALKGTEVNNKWTVTDANGMEMTVTKTTIGENVTEVPTEDGRNLKVNALKWTGAANTIYAVEYVNGNNKYYKIVTVK